MQQNEFNLDNILYKSPEGEMWKYPPRYENILAVSTFGRAYALERDVVCKNGTVKHYTGRFLNTYPTHEGYLQVMVPFNLDRQRPYGTMHRLVASTFIHNPENLPFIDHIDRVESNDCIHNLLWVTAKQNNDHRIQSQIDPKEMNFAWIQKGKDLRKVSIFDIRDYLSQGYQFSSSIGFHDQIIDPDCVQKIKDTWSRKSSSEMDAFSSKVSSSVRAKYANGAPGSFTGKHHTEETKLKLSIAHRGVHLSESARRNIAEGIRKKSQDPEYRQKQSEGMKGRIWINNGIINQRLKVEDAEVLLASGEWTQGQTYHHRRTPDYDDSMKQSISNKISKALSNTIWITNGKECRRIRVEDSQELLASGE